MASDGGAEDEDEQEEDDDGDDDDCGHRRLGIVEPIFANQQDIACRNREWIPGARFQ
jgi:hypothetical protein